MGWIWEKKEIREWKICLTIDYDQRDLREKLRNNTFTGQNNDEVEVIFGGCSKYNIKNRWLQKKYIYPFYLFRIFWCNKLIS